MLPAVAPVTKPTLASAGRPRRSSAQRAAVPSIAIDAGDIVVLEATWSQLVTSQSAARPAGSVPPITKPKKRGPALPINPGSAAAASSEMIRSGSSPASGSGASNAACMASKSAAGPTRRDGRESSQAWARRVVRSSSVMGCSYVKAGAGAGVPLVVVMVLKMVRTRWRLRARRASRLVLPSLRRRLM